MTTHTGCKTKRIGKTAHVTEALLELARVRGPDGKLPTLQEMCEQFDIARGTLERAMAALEQRGLLYRKHGSGIYVTTRIRQKTIGVVYGGNIFTPEQYSPFWLLLLQAVRKQGANRSELRLQTYLDIPQADEGFGGHAQLMRDIANHRLEGVLLFTPDYRFDEPGQLRASGVPLVVFGGAEPHWSVLHDPKPLIRLAAHELAAKGCRRIALLGADVLPHRALLESELCALNHSAECLDWSLETWGSRLPGGMSRERFGCEVARRAAAAGELPPDGLLSMDDTATRGVIAALLEAGIRPGRDIQIATGANKGSPVLGPYENNLIRLEYDPAESVRASMEMLETLMAGGTPPVNPVLIEPSLAGGR
jgi:DNA-binding LacI/PurR family transcriptional regulator